MADTQGQVSEVASESVENEKPLWSINEPKEDDGSESVEGALGSTNAPKEKTIDKIIDETTKKQTKVAKAEPKVEEKPKEPAAKRKLVVDKEEIELDEDQITRWAQKGIALEKKSYSIAKSDKEVKATQAAVAKREAELAETYEALKTGSFEVLEELHGPEKARELAEAYLRPKIEKEIQLSEMSPQDRKVYDAEQRARAAEERAAKIESTQQQEKMTAEEAQWSKHYQKVIIDTLKEGGVPQTDYTAAEVAAWIRRGKAHKIEYNPQQLAQLVKEDNILRVGALTKNYVDQIAESRKTNNVDGINSAGEALVELLGEPVMYAIAKYYVTKKVSEQPSMPKKIIDTAKTTQNDQPRKRMTEDEYKAEIKRRAAAIDSGATPAEW